jgi:hypothetical protein
MQTFIQFVPLLLCTLAAAIPTYRLLGRTGQSRGVDRCRRLPSCRLNGALSGLSHTHGGRFSAMGSAGSPLAGGAGPGPLRRAGFNGIPGKIQMYHRRAG